MRMALSGGLNEPFLERFLRPAFGACCEDLESHVLLSYIYSPLSIMELPLYETHAPEACRVMTLEKGIWPGVRARQLDLYPS